MERTRVGQAALQSVIASRAHANPCKLQAATSAPVELWRRISPSQPKSKSKLRVNLIYF